MKTPKSLNIQINESTLFPGRYNVRVVTRSGKIYIADYADQPTDEMVREQWNQDRRWFTHIN
ncbi:hypothetical protein BK126_26140 [Paenibacillus sp. FSL H7-0326]|uniref:hypothetical protein n=1 Tax=Paenibacillus sp. FSL H7-0326 TaxID=1921144 RepID=UPI00096C5900|nr:hypothetical protein [Paenibacillus sp. FSL H7-0326]OMC63677.1 hypothetical protein BK126_26140 [Paenibacillus sp. FSL H7-0326]